MLKNAVKIENVRGTWNYKKECIPSTLHFFSDILFLSLYMTIFIVLHFGRSRTWLGNFNLTDLKKEVKFYKGIGVGHQVYEIEGRLRMLHPTKQKKLIQMQDTPLRGSVYLIISASHSLLKTKEDQTN